MMNPLVEAARAYLGVPFKHRGRDRRGLDCAGLVWCAYRDCGVSVPDMGKYGREPYNNGMMTTVIAGAGRPLWEGRPGETVPRALLKVGDVVVIRFDVHPHHIGILGDDRIHGLSLIHANGRRDLLARSGVGIDRQGRVMEHGLDAAHQAMICAVFRRPV